MNRPTLQRAIDIRQADPQILAWVENQLTIGGYLAACQNNGELGQSTIDALAEFKDDFYLAYPSALGESTIEALARLEAPHPISEQNARLNQRPDPAAGSRSGQQIILPIVGSVFLNEWILPNSFLSYAEFTHGGTRIPNTEIQVRNMRAIAEQFGWIRRRFGSAIGVTSAFRPEHINRRVGGAPNSWHIRAGALDIFPVNGQRRSLLQVIQASDAGGIGVASSFYHIDIGLRRLWDYD